MMILFCMYDAIVTDCNVKPHALKFNSASKEHLDPPQLRTVPRAIAHSGEPPLRTLGVQVDVCLTQRGKTPGQI
jgi:hypothetical protein